MGTGGVYRTFAREGQAGVSAGLSPAYGRATARASFVPAPILELGVRGDAFRFFGTRAATLSFPSRDADYGQSARDRLSGREELGYGRRVTLEPTLRARWDRWIVLNQTEWSRYWLDGRGPFILELEYDTLVKPHDSIFVNRTVLLFAHRESKDAGRLLYGPFYEYQRAAGARLERTRVGGAIDLAFRIRRWPDALPRFYGMTGFNTTDRIRRHQLFFVGGLGIQFPMHSKRG